VAREKGIMGGHESGEQALKWTEKWENKHSKLQSKKKGNLASKYTFVTLNLVIN
jgi:hypothetical protein